MGLLLLSTLLATAGCGAQIGSAAVVGDVAISTDDVERQASAVHGITSDTLVTELTEVGMRLITDRRVLTYQIWHQLLAQSGLSTPLTNEQITGLIAQYQGVDALNSLLSATSETLNDRLSDTAALRTLVTGAVDSGATVVTPAVEVDYLIVDSIADAQRKRTEYLAEPAAMTDAVAAATASQRGGSGSATFLQGADLVSTGVFSAAAGQIVISPAEGGEALLIRVVSRIDEPVTLDQSTVDQLSVTQMNAVGALVLAQQARALPAVAVNPRFGSWDPSLLQVVSTEGLA